MTLPPTRNCNISGMRKMLDGHNQPFTWPERGEIMPLVNAAELAQPQKREPWYRRNVKDAVAIPVVLSPFVIAVLVIALATHSAAAFFCGLGAVVIGVFLAGLASIYSGLFAVLVLRSIWKSALWVYLQLRRLIRGGVGHAPRR